MDRHRKRMQAAMNQCRWQLWNRQDYEHRSVYQAGAMDGLLRRRCCPNDFGQELQLAYREGFRTGKALRI